jgi:hypothetical protein
MTFRYSVTFEFVNRQPVTHKGELVCKAVHTASQRAVKAAKKALSPIRWCSVVCVLERDDAVEPDTETGSPSDEVDIEATEA